MSRNFLYIWENLSLKGYIEAPILDFWSVTPVNSTTSAHVAHVSLLSRQRGHKWWNLQGRRTQILLGGLKCTYFYLAILKFIAIFIKLYIEVVFPNIGIHESFVYIFGSCTCHQWKGQPINLTN